MTPLQLSKIATFLKEPKLSIYTNNLNAAMAKFEINTPARQAAFLAQVLHESGECRYVKELASGAEYDVGQKAINLGNTPQDDGDGERYKGRGLIQITGLSNYKQISKYFGVDFVKTPELLEQPEWASMSAAWFWNSRKLSLLADINTDESFKQITKKINGGYNHIAERRAYWAKAKVQLGVVNG